MIIVRMARPGHKCMLASACANICKLPHAHILFYVRINYIHWYEYYYI